VLATLLLEVQQHLQMMTSDDVAAAAAAAAAAEAGAHANPQRGGSSTPKCQTQEQQQRLVRGGDNWQADAPGVLHARCALASNATRAAHSTVLCSFSLSVGCAVLPVGYMQE
jgi:hypothetical protein